MRNFKSGSKSRGRKGSSRRSFGGRDSRRPPMYDAVCDECGKDCKVPFRPSGGKPIYCSDCFEKRGGKDGGRLDRRPSRSSRSSMDNRSILQLIEKIEALNTRLDKIIKLLSSVGEKKSGLVKSRAKITKTPRKKPKQK